MRKISLTEKIILNFMLLGMGIIIIIASYSFYTAKDALMNRTFEQLTSVRTVKKNQIENFFNDRFRDINLISGSEDIKKLLSIIETYNFDNHNHSDYIQKKINEEYNRYLRLYLSSCGYYNNLLIFNNNGVGLKIKTLENDSNSVTIDSISNYDVKDLMSNINKNKKTFLQDFIIDRKTKKAAMYLGSTIYSKNKQIIGIAALEISAEAINAIMIENNPHNGLGKTGESYLVGKDFLMRSNSRFHDNSILKTKVETPAVTNSFKNISDIGIFEDYRNIEVLSSFSRLSIPDLEWCICAEIDFTEATIAVYNLRNNVILISVLLSVILFISSFLISKRITRPIIKLKEATINISKGEYSEKIPIYSNDEIGSLTESFNYMVMHLEKQNIELQEERKLRMQSVLNGQEMERQRLSRELHDGLGQLLIALKLRLEGLNFLDKSKLITSIEGIKKLFDSTIDEVKRISYDLLPAVLFEFGLAKAVQNLCEEFENRTKIKIHFSFECDSDMLNKTQKTYFFRIIQEALNNIAKHANATKTEVSLIHKNNKIYLIVEDNGKGFDLQERMNQKNTNGIYNMRERIILLNGEFEIESAPDKGCRISAQIPLD